MSHQGIHKDFLLNRQQFSSKNDLLVYAQNLDLKLYSFLTDWFDTSPVLTVHTSGSTGKPKPIQLKKAHMVNSALATGTYFELLEKTTALLCLSTDYIAGKMMLVRALVLGWHLDIVDAGSYPLEGLQKVYDFSAMVPLQVHNSIDSLHYIKTLIIGGGVVSKELEQKIMHLETAVFATYGMTETVTHIAIKKLNQFSTYAKPNQQYTILPNVKISKDVRGCLVIDAPKISNEQVITNDVVELISETEFKWLGRYDTIINSGGIKLIPEQIEQKLSTIIDNRFFVSGLPDKILGEKLIIIIEKSVNSSDSDANRNYITRLRNFKSLSKYEVPKEVYFVDQFIETETKKVNRQKTLKKLLRL